VGGGQFEKLRNYETNIVFAKTLIAKYQISNPWRPNSLPSSDTHAHTFKETTNMNEAPLPAVSEEKQQ